MYQHILSLMFLYLVCTQEDKDDTLIALKEIEKREFGNALISMIQVQIQQNQTIDNINNQLIEFTLQINDNQLKNDQFRKIKSIGCNRILNGLDQTINYNTDMVASNTLMRDNNIKQLAQAKIDLDQNIQDINQNQNTQILEQATRDELNQLWKQQDSDQNDAISAIDEASKLINDIQSGQQFIQLKPQFEQIKKRFESNDAYDAILSPIIGSLSELASNEDILASRKILQLLSQLRQQIDESQINLKNTEQQQKIRWTEFSLHLQNEYNRLIDHKAYIEQSIKNYNENIASSIFFIDAHMVELQSTQDAKIIQQTLCDLQDEKFQQITEQRNQQLNDIKLIQQNLAERLANILEYLSDRM